MLLALDVRNSGIIVGWRGSGGWAGIARLGADRSSDELGILLQACARRAGVADDTALDDAWISSVVPAATGRVVAAVSSTFGLEPSVVGPGTKTGIKIRTDTPSELGSDIVCSAVAARALSPGAAIIVDFGAAIVASALNSAGELLGVSIAPGLETAAHSLRASAAQLIDIRLERPKKAIGKNTAQSVQSGIFFGYGGLVGRLVQLMTSEMGEDAAVIGTGDEAGRSLLEGIGYPRFVPDLALDGLALIAERNGRR